MSYIYTANLDQQNNFTQIEIQLDNGSTALLVMGGRYDLTAGELSRAGRYVILTFSALPAVNQPIGITRLPVKGMPAPGQVPVWSATEGAFIPTTLGSGNGSDPELTARVQLLEMQGVKSVVFNEAIHSWPVRPTATVVLWVGGGAADDPTELMSQGDLWFPSG